MPQPTHSSARHNVTIHPEGATSLPETLGAPSNQDEIEIPSVDDIARAAIPDSVPGHHQLRLQRQAICTYVQRYLKDAILCLPYGQLAPGKGKNLAIYPFLAPTMAPGGGTVDSSQVFGEQYRWDCFFTNEFLVRVGLETIAVAQLKNLSHVFEHEGRIPNALRSGFLSHSQPPLDAASAFQMVEAGAAVGDWFHQAMNTVEKELYTEWFDRGLKKVNPRQNALTECYGTLLTRHASFHYHPFIAGVEDGKDHNWVTISYGENYLPVQLNSIICLNLRLLADYHHTYRGDPERSQLYKTLHERMAEEIRATFWVDSGRWRGFRNFSLREHERRPIFYGDLAAEIFPLFAGVATAQQAFITIQNLTSHYLCCCGLASTAIGLRLGGSIPKPPEDMTFQWEENVWPPLMMIAFAALENYKHIPGAMNLRNDLARRWVQHQETVFARDGVFWEKAPRESEITEQPGFYGNLPGFGWTISSYFKALQILQEVAITGP